MCQFIQHAVKCQSRKRETGVVNASPSSQNLGDGEFNEFNVIRGCTAGEKPPCAMRDPCLGKIILD